MEPTFIVLAIAAVAVVLFVTERFPPDLVALLVLVTLAMSGVLTPAEALSGFASSATLTILAMFVLSAAVVKTGVVTVLANRLHKLGSRREGIVILVLGVSVAPASAFMNNTAVVAIMIPLVVSLAVEARRAPSRFLIPLSYAAQMGGVLTLIGTSTNILASEISAAAGHRPLQMFEFAPVGIVILVIGMVYLVFVAPRLLPHRDGGSDAEVEPEFEAYLVLAEGASAAGISAGSKDAALRLGGEVISVRRAGHLFARDETTLEPGDVIHVRGPPRTLLHAEPGSRFMPYGTERFERGLVVEEGYAVVEVVVSPGSAYVGSVRGLGRLALSDAHVIGIHRKERFVPKWLTPEVEAGDTLLVMVRSDRLAEFRDSPDLILVQEVPLLEFQRHRVPHILAIFAGVVGLAALDVLPIVVTALAGAALVVITGILDMREFYRAIRWDVVFLLAGLVPLGVAIVKTGGADAIAGLLVASTASLPPWGLLLSVYVATALLTEVLSNNATVLLMVPVVVSTATTLALDPTPFVLAVAYAASTSFMTPVGYQTNTMVYGPGAYRFSDFFRVGGPLNFVLALATTAALATVYGLY